MHDIEHTVVPGGFCILHISPPPLHLHLRTPRRRRSPQPIGVALCAGGLSVSGEVGVGEGNMDQSWLPGVVEVLQM